MNTPHYQPLFVYDKTEYEQWAKGLQLCGYASDPAYADKLIRTVKLYNLHELDYYTIQYIAPSKLTTSGDVGSSQNDKHPLMSVKGVSNNCQIYCCNCCNTLTIKRGF